MEFEKEQLWRRLSGTGEYQEYYASADELERQSFRTWLKSLLHSQKIIVEFTKVNGETRVMECTLAEQHGAKYATKSVTESVETKVKKQSEDSCPVWDTRANAWRSFRWDKLKKIDFKV